MTSSTYATPSSAARRVVSMASLSRISGDRSRYTQVPHRSRSSSIDTGGRSTTGVAGVGGAGVAGDDGDYAALSNEEIYLDYVESAFADPGGSDLVTENALILSTLAVVTGLAILAALYGRRLDLRDEDAQTAFAAAAKDRLQPLVEGVVGAFEEIVLTPEQLAKKRGIDAGDDLNVDKGAGGTFGIDEGAAVGAGSPEKVLSELAAVVDFVLGNGLATEPAELGGADRKSVV